jgi:hypothetical protein
MTPNFFNALATVTGTSGSVWTAQDAGISRGLFIPRCLIVQGGGKVFFRVDDGIHYSNRGLGSQSITDADLYPLFTHEGSTPKPVVRQQFSQQGPYLYYDYIGLGSGTSPVTDKLGAAANFALLAYSGITNGD